MSCTLGLKEEWYLFCCLITEMPAWAKSSLLNLSFYVSFHSYFLILLSFLKQHLLRHTQRSFPNKGFWKKANFLQSLLLSPIITMLLDNVWFYVAVYFAYLSWKWKCFYFYWFLVEWILCQQYQQILLVLLDIRTFRALYLNRISFNSVNRTWMSFTNDFKQSHHF